MSDRVLAINGGSPVNLDGPPDWPRNDPEVADALARAVKDRSWGKYHGPHCQTFTDELSVYHDGAETQLCSSGTAAVELALRGLGVASGDEVILAAYDFKGNFQDILAIGAVPVLVDVRSDNWQLDHEQLAEAVSDKTKAIIASHLHGGVVNMPKLMRFAREHGIGVLEDACQVTGANLFGAKAGLTGDVGVLSFGGSKLLSAGRGGAVFSKRSDIMQRIRLYQQRGNDAYPMSELQALVLSPQLRKLDNRNQIRLRSVATIQASLTADCGLRLLDNSHASFTDEDAPGYYKLGMQYDPTKFGDVSRDEFANAIRAEGIALDPGFRSLHRIHSRRRFKAIGELPVATEADSRILTLHHPVLLEDAETLDQVHSAITKLGNAFN